MKRSIVTVLVAAFVALGFGNAFAGPSQAIGVGGDSYVSLLFIPNTAVTYEMGLTEKQSLKFGLGTYLGQSYFASAEARQYFKGEGIRGGFVSGFALLGYNPSVTTSSGIYYFAGINLGSKIVFGRDAGLFLEPRISVSWPGIFGIGAEVGWAF